MRYLIIAAAAMVAAAQPQSGPEQRARDFLDLLVKENFAAAQVMLDESLQPKLPVSTLGQLWGQVQKGAGPFRRVTGARLETSDESDAVFLTCEFDKAVFDLRIPVDKSSRIGPFTLAVHVDYTAPDYVDISTFHEKEVLVGTELPLHGTLTIPNGSGPFPAVILVHGSGAGDRDETAGPNKPFRDLAEGLATRGVVVLRYNKRSNEHAPELAKVERLTVKEEFMDDALAAVALLRGMGGIDHQKIFVLTHSLSGTVAPRIARADPTIAGIILFAGAARPLLNMIIPQMTVNYTLQGPMTAAQQRSIEKMRAQIARANDPALTPDTPSSEMPLGFPASYLLDLRGYHPELLARESKQPFLVLQGDRDYQVTMEDFDLWKTGLSPKKNVEFRVYPKLNHLFMTGDNQSSDEDYKKPGHVAKPVIEDIAAWVKR